MGGENLLERLKMLAEAEPHKRVRLIFRLNRDPAGVTDEFRAAGAVIWRRFELLNAVAIEIEAKRALELEEKDWVVKVEEDMEVEGL